ncbi:nitronate monooxygenase [Pseudonocardia sp. C8]|uniref:NAD(P)H-dependent flavin oxidoreductase n=1 Tax=Pseudonocardia sp. C8 TaxID=2762759 RepID=UPI00164337E2|nr:nitronate monooxygenase [Pseudonocardia sp. C8]MBC3194313.1 nitronate monooxygenase [Pseudonocardia sp. C8]
MLHTRLCDLLRIEVPILCAPFGPWPEVELAAAVCSAGGLGSLGTAAAPLPVLRERWSRLRDLTDRPFAVNHAVRPFDEEAFDATLAFRPDVISFHQLVCPDLVARAHERGILWVQQVMHRAQAEEALRAGADVIVAQGGEAGGHSGSVAGMVLLAQVLDLAGDVPVVLAGGVADGRGLAAALAMGASGVCMGTRFLASTEMAVHADWKRRIVEADALDAVKVANDDLIMPPYTRPGAPPHRPRALRTPLVDALADRPGTVDGAAVGAEFLGAVARGRGDEYLPFAGQTVGLVHDVRPAAEIIHEVTAGAAAALQAAAALTAPPAREHQPTHRPST